MIQFACLQCGMKFQLKVEFAGRTTKCPTCKQPLVVPSPDATRAYVPSEFIDGATSRLHQAGLDAGVTLGQAEADVPRGGKPIAQLLASRTRKDERYLLEDEIARGGMGAVVRAVDCDLRREVAIKFMLGEQDVVKKARFVAEAQITGQLEHPNIVPIHEIGIDAQNRVFFTMKLVHGRSLAQIVNELREHPRQAEKTWTLSRLLSILVSICHALAYAHSRRVVHRDLKPANIMVGDFGEVYVMDWGLAKVLAEQVTPLITLPSRFQTAGKTIAENPKVGSTSSKVETNRRQDEDLTQDGAVLGTPVYMPPEQARGEVEGIDERSDLYSLGAILYELLTLFPPISNEGGYFAILMRVAEGEIAAPAARSPERFQQGKVPPELSAIAMKALAKEPGDRYQSVQALRRDIERFQDGHSVSAKEDTKWEMATKFVKRNKGFSATSSVALVVLAVVLGIAFRVNYGARLHAEEQERRAVQTQVASEQSQRDKEQAVREALPAFMGAGRQLANEGKFAEAQKQVEVALIHEPQNTAAHLLKCHILLAQKDWAKAQAELTLYLQRQPRDRHATALLTLSQKDMKDPTVLFALTEVLGAQKLYGLAGALTRDIEIGVATRKPFLKQYQDRIDAAWPGLGKFLVLGQNGEFLLNFMYQKQVSSLDPLKDMRLHKLYLSNCPNITDLEPLREMPLTLLILGGCNRIGDLRPLQKMPLTELDISACFDVVDLEPLRGMLLSKLKMSNCTKATDLGPLKGMPLTSLDLISCGEISDLRPLKGMSLLTELLMVSCYKVADLEPLRGLPLQTLRMPSTSVRSLEPLRNMPLKVLDIYQNVGIQDLSPLKGMPLTHLQLQLCPKASDLTPLEGMKLQAFGFTPRYIEKGLEIIRRMESLKTITVDKESFPADVFWKRYDAGEFRK